MRSFLRSTFMMGVPVRDVLAANLTALQAPTGPHGIAPEEMQKILAAADQRAADAPRRYRPRWDSAGAHEEKRHPCFLRASRLCLGGARKKAAHQRPALFLERQWKARNGNRGEGLERAVARRRIRTSRYQGRALASFPSHLMRRNYCGRKFRS